MKILALLVMLTISNIAYAISSDIKCLASVIWHEGRGEPLAGQIAIGNVVLSRLKFDRFPKSICKVAFQKNQFSDLHKIRYDDKTIKLATQILLTKTFRDPINATFYHRADIHPFWADWNKLVKIDQIGNHVFYRLREMPIYDFECKLCKVTETTLQHHASKEPTCPICGKIMDKVLSHPTGFIFKGKGFYATDYAKGS